MNLGNYKWPENYNKRFEEIHKKYFNLKAAQENGYEAINSEGDEVWNFPDHSIEIDDLEQEMFLLETFKGFADIEQAKEIMQKRADSLIELRKCSCKTNCSSCDQVFEYLDDIETRIKSAAAEAFIKSQSKYAKNLTGDLR